MGMKEEVERAMRDAALDSNGKISAEFAFPEPSAVFAGHFPSTPVIPGVCLAQCVLAAISRVSRKQFSLQSIKKARFNNPAGPNDLLAVSGLPEWNGAAVQGKFDIVKKGADGAADTRIARISLKAIALD